MLYIIFCVMKCIKLLLRSKLYFEVAASNKQFRFKISKGFRSDKHIFLLKSGLKLCIFFKFITNIRQLFNTLIL